MAQKIITICDACTEFNSEDVLADTYPVSGYLVDLCAGHAEQMTLYDAVEFAIQHGRKDDGKKNGAGPKRKAKQPRESVEVNPIDPNACPKCGKVAASPTGLKMHMTRSHKGES